MNKFKLANLQLKTTGNIEKDFSSLEKMLKKVKEKDELDYETFVRNNSEDEFLKTSFVTLPEMWNVPYITEEFPKRAEKENGYSVSRLSDIAKENNIYLSAGSMAEIDDKKNVYNTAYVFSRDGKIIGKHRKVHLFDIDVKGGQRFMESDTLSSGKNITTFETEYCKMGLEICFDIRFPEMARIQALEGAKVIIVPGAFNMTTGPLHWELLFRGRAVENQVFIVGTAPARDKSASYTSYGHSIIVDPWGKVISDLGIDVNFSSNIIDLDEVDKVRREIPLLGARKEDVYRKYL